NLTKRFGSRVAVEGLSLEIAAGESYGLLGPNGAGKTTTISLVCGLLRPDGGEVVVAGHRLDGDDLAAKKAIGYVPQEVALYPDMTARENLSFFGRLYGLSGAALARRIDAVLEIVGLTERAADRISEYSGGMKRRANIAAGLLHEPELLVLDEPTVGVDPQSRNAILESVEQLAAGGKAVLYASHYMEEVERLCDRVGILDEGHLIAEGSRRDLLATVGQSGRVELVASGPLEALAEACRALPSTEEATVADGRVEVVGGDPRSLLPRLLEAASGVGVSVKSVEVVEPDLEAVFLHLTGKALRD
ncbi:MAG TPA: ABC transporter ATP-binding protein, partial [Acidimicrobiales bacterium]|nr:ABC transporter ATP-binding protein [Acidimicrobiales bacterium]